MEPLVIALLITDFILTGLVVYLIFGLRGLKGMQKVVSETEPSCRTSIDREKEEIQNMKEELEGMKLELKKRQERLSTVITRVEEALTSMLKASSSAEMADSYVKALAMLKRGESPDAVVKKLGLYRGEVELLCAIERLSSR